MLRDIVIDRVKQKTVDGIAYSFDSTRGKWLSIERCCISYGINHKNINSSRWLAIANGIYTNNIGFKIPGISNPGTITAATIQIKNINSCDFVIIENDDEEGVVTLQLSNENEKSVDLNIDIQPESVLKCFMISNGNLIDYPSVVLKYAARL